MKKTILSGILPAAFLLLPAVASAFEPVAPSDLNANVNGMVVDLSWGWGNAGNAVLTSDFECESLSQAGWEVKNTYDYDINGNWTILTTEQESETVSHSGNCAAILMATEAEDDPSANHQDEWLIVRPGVGAVYMDFWYFLHPELLEVGGYREFPDHYYVKISYDNGESWEELWDGRWDMGRYEGVQQASLFLGTETDEDTLVAFNAVSGDEETLYFLWAVDDVEFYSEEEIAERKLSVRARTAAPDMQLPRGISVSRPFVPQGFLSQASRVSPSEWLNNGNMTFRVYLDGEMIADYLKARHFTDYSTKEPGEHLFEVLAWSEAMDEEYEAASLSVHIDEVTFAPPCNVVAGFEPQEDGKYLIHVAWDAPDDDMQPAYYNVTVNGKSIGWITPDDELALGQSGIYKGAYTFGVEAIYEFPEGTSESIYASVYPGTVPTVQNLVATPEDGAVALRWDAPATDALQYVTYSVYRGDELVASDLADTSYTDSDPQAGRCLYHVHAVYGDEVSLPLSVAYGEPVVFSLPYEQKFDNGHVPAGWDVELIDPYIRVKDMYSWRFDNWFDINFPQESGIDGGCASVSGLASGMNALQTFVVSPDFELPSDSEPQLTFTKYYYEETAGPTGSAQFVLGISTDDGANWSDLAILHELANGEMAVSLADYKGKTVRLRWGFLARNSGEAAIDNVMLTDEPAGIDSVLGAPDVVDVYTVNGVLLMTSVRPETLTTLPKGLYILKDFNGVSTKYLAH